MGISGHSKRAESPLGDRADDGGAMVEFALILPLLLAFMLGTVTIGISYNRSISLNNAARESARYGAVRPVNDDVNQWLNTVADIARAGATGDLAPGVDGQYVCVAYVHPDGTEPADSTTRLIELAGVRTIVTGQSCFLDGRPNEERRVQVEVRRRSNLEAVIYTQTLTLDSRSVARFERVPS